MATAQKNVGLVGGMEARKVTRKVNTFLYFRKLPPVGHVPFRRPDNLSQCVR